MLPGQRVFTRRNLFRMRQFYEVYRGDEKVTPLVTQLPWTHNLIILTQAKRAEEREFYLRLAVQERWGKRELERQFRLAAFEQAVLTPAQVSPAVTQLYGQAGAVPVQGRLRARIPGPASCAYGSRSPPGLAGPAAHVPD
jgi:hypothetical protein